MLELAKRLVVLEPRGDRQGVIEIDTRLAELSRPTDYATWSCCFNGGFSPLTGFMARDDHERVYAEMRLADGTL